MFRLVVVAYMGLKGQVRVTNTCLPGLLGHRQESWAPHSLININKRTCASGLCSEDDRVGNLSATADDTHCIKRSTDTLCTYNNKAQQIKHSGLLVGTGDVECVLGSAPCGAPHRDEESEPTELLGSPAACGVSHIKINNVPNRLIIRLSAE